MALADWGIYGPGGQSIVDFDGSQRCELDGVKWMLWNGNPTLVDCEIVADIRLYGTAGYNRGGLILRSDIDAENCYRFERRYYGSGDLYYIWLVVDGVATQIAYAQSSHSWTEWVKTRFRIDGWQISLSEYYNGDWHQAMLLEETNHVHASGYVGLSGVSNNPVGAVLFDNVEIAEKS